MARKLDKILKKFFLIGLFVTAWTHLQAQNDFSAFQFINLPASSHAAALGGENISIIEDDLTLSLHNPALLSCVANNTLSLYYMHYMSGINMTGATFAHVVGERSTWAVAAQYIDYGSLIETTEENISTGTFSAKDIAVSGIYTYNLSDYWSGGVRTNLIYSHYASYTSVAVGVDLGLNYYDHESGFSASVVTRNLGGQLKSFDEHNEKLPINLQIGFSKTLSHAPFRLSLTLHDMTHWSNMSMQTDKWSQKLLNHLAIGVDFIPTSNFYIATGYNFRRGNEMEIAGSSHWAGFTAGTGIRIKRLKAGFTYAKYHVSASSLLFNLSYIL